MKTFVHIATTILLFSGICVAANHVSTVPWNGHRGAVTFTFDDAYVSQLKYVVPALDKRGIRATFFMIGSSWGANRDAWIKIARNGHELGNHTLTHASLGGLDSAGVEKEISGMADTLRAADSSIQAVTLAYPYCATSDLIDRIADRQNIVARICGWDPRWNPRSTWGEPPAKWMEANSIGITDTATVRAALTEIDRADSARSWLVTLNHGIMDNSYGPISDAAAESMFDRALTHDLWIGTYMEVAAYWRASAVMDAARATTASDGWTLSWKSPHPRMPRSVPLRVRLDSATFGKTFSVWQDGKTIAPAADGSFVIEFMKLSLRVSSSPVGVARREPTRAILRRTTSGLVVEGLDPGIWRADQVLPSGRIVASQLQSVSAGAQLSFTEAVRTFSLLRLRSASGSVLELRTPPRL